MDKGITLYDAFGNPSLHKEMQRPAKPKSPRSLLKCECGVDSSPSGGLHSEYCQKYEPDDE